MKFNEVLGIDVGGSGIKGAPVNTKKGVLLDERFRIPTPSPATPEKVAGVINEIAKHFNWKGPIGIGFPSVIVKGVVKTASNIDKSWIDTNGQQLISKVTGLPVHLVNDADSAGLAEIRFGAGKKVKGTVVMVTVGTGIGTALFTRGRLVSNTELGHVFLNNGKVAEKFAADSIRQAEDLNWLDWGARFNEYLKEIEKLFWPELIIIGGGVSKKPEKYMSAVSVKAPIVMAQQRNEAGIIGAAIAAKRNKKELRELFIVK
jgi:polyphosphate glucokinase